VSVREAQEITGLSRSFFTAAIHTGRLTPHAWGLGTTRPRVQLDVAEIASLVSPRPVLRAKVEAHQVPDSHPTSPSRDKGFTLIELLVVVIIIGILAGIAIPVFMDQKSKAYDAQVKAQVATVAKAVETAFVEGAGTVYRNGATVAVDGGSTESVVTSSGVTWDVSGDGTGYCIVAWRSDARGRYGQTTPVVYSSNAGGIAADCTAAPTVPAGFTSGGASGTGTPPAPVGTLAVGAVSNLVDQRANITVTTALSTPQSWTYVLDMTQQPWTGMTTAPVLASAVKIGGTSQTFITGGYNAPKRTATYTSTSALKITSTTPATFTLVATSPPVADASLYTVTQAKVGTAVGTGVWSGTSACRLVTVTNKTPWYVSTAPITVDMTDAFAQLTNQPGYWTGISGTLAGGTAPTSPGKVWTIPAAGSGVRPGVPSTATVCVGSW